ncbi:MULTISPECIES: glycoside hydrolase family 3 C-terminal domain-containing protein [Vagococcus]|uniref:Beta-glucosidase n=1 Tax=Vagococcus fluvialis bH819 TaxID=1255619 RepID=A0A1X6WQP4_9ENTE|nr:MULTISPECIES: glycoside hydrolase family 3 C-terminal domain-containing protein [Vagococcus]SLM86562.1 Beta-glucosidase [Vagococcus fluvialis bH819]HCM90769.1 glycosyl hydrolase [Vagococcus sp.]
MLKNKTIIDQLTLEQKASLLSGKNTWETYDIPGLFPSMFLSDGPHGVRKQLGEADHLGLNESVPSTCFPTAATLANSWDENLLEKVGEYLGREANHLGVQVLLGPGLNIKKNPKCGRNFEYYSEDPYFSGKLAAASIRGIQKNQTIACPKHFAVNSQEYRRMASDSIIDERTLQEIYLTGFEIAVKEGHPKSIMSSYNLINGTYANENKKLLRDILRDNWKFDGFVVSDWGGDNDHTQGVINGSHLAMPSPGVNGPIEIVESVKSGKLPENILNERVDELLSVILTSTAMSKETEIVDWKEHHQVAKEAAMKSVVLLKNSEHILPIDITKKVGIIGEFAKKPRYQGAGSSVVNPKQLENTLELVADYPINFVGFSQGFERGKQVNETLEKEAVALAETSDIILLYVGLDEILESEGMDRPHTQMPNNQLNLIKELSKTSAKIVVVLSAGASMEMPWLDQVDSVLHGYLGGQAGAGAMLEVITGKYNPSGKLSETYPISYKDVLFGEEFPYKGKYAYYKEGIFVGYRYYDRAKKEVLFPFGFGLSYTHFKYSQLEVQSNDVIFKMTNQGTCEGTEIAQLYIGKSDSQISRAEKELKGFVKVSLLPGETKEVRISLDDKAFRYFNVDTNQWEVESGNYQLMMGASSRDIRLVTDIVKEGTESQLPKNEEKLAKFKTSHFSDLEWVDFERLYGQKVPVEVTKGRQLLHANSVISEMSQAKNPLARLVRRIIYNLIKKSEKKGEPNLNLLFIYNMPFRAIGKMTNGMVSQEMVDKIVHMVNGHFFSGLGGLFKAYKKNKKQTKEFMR